MLSCNLNLENNWEVDGFDCMDEQNTVLSMAQVHGNDALIAYTLIRKR